MAKSSPDLTMCLCNWARPEQTHVIIDELCRQSCRPAVWVWNNNPDIVFQDDRADLVINCSENMHVRHVPALWQMARTPFVGRMDDDLHFADDEVLGEALSVLATLRHSSQMLGAFGVRIYEGGDYENGHHILVPKGHGQHLPNGRPKAAQCDLPVDVLKGRILLAKQAASNYLRADCPHVHVDLHMSMQLAGRRRLWHVVSGVFYDRARQRARLLDFPVDKKGYCDLEGHHQQRNELCRRWVQSCPRDFRVKKLPSR